MKKCAICGKDIPPRYKARKNQEKIKYPLI